MKPFAVLAFLAGAVIFAFLILKAGFAPIAQALATLGFGGLIIVVLLHLPLVMLMGIAWWSLVRGNSGVNFGKFILARVLRDGTSEVLPFSQLGGFVFGARAVILAGVSGFLAALSTVADLIVEFAARLPYLAVGLALLAWLKPDSDLIRPIAITLAICVILLTAALLARRRTYGLIENGAIRFSRRWPALNHADVKSSLSKIFSSWQCFGFAFLLHLTAWFLGAVEAYVVFRLMHVHVGLGQAAVIDSLFSAIRSFAFFVPGAIGVQEGAYVLLCALFGISAPAAIAFSLARRARDLMLGIPAVAVWQMIEGKRVFKPQLHR